MPSNLWKGCRLPEGCRLGEGREGGSEVATLELPAGGTQPPRCTMCHEVPKVAERREKEEDIKLKASREKEEKQTSAKAHAAQTVKLSALLTPAEGAEGEAPKTGQAGSRLKR